MACSLDENAPDDATLGTGLVRDKRLPQQRGSETSGLLGTADKFYAPSLATAARVNLGFDHRLRLPKKFKSGRSLVRRRSYLTSGDGRAVFSQDSFCLVFVNVHVE